MKRWRRGTALVAGFALAACPRDRVRETTPDTVAVTPPHHPVAPGR